ARAEHPRHRRRHSRGTWEASHFPRCHELSAHSAHGFRKPAGRLTRAAPVRSSGGPGHAARRR
ncbi:hypothetical protein ACFVYA_32050, partial [Amycolatopsis sp. NPDC058278]|uniref:hypothetical protein n=1 Tax=Amycolatopsis sp. NPDC058278 TaxID=3346417 RepID=UPI0036D89516